MERSIVRMACWSAGVLFMLARTSAAIDVSSCATSIPHGQVGELVADLDCDAGPVHCADDPSLVCDSAGGVFVNNDCASTCIRYGVHLARNAKLHLNGHTISGGDYGVLCRDFGCTIDGGGGTIANQEFMAVWLFGGGKLSLSDVTIHHDKGGALGAAYFAHKMILRRVDIHHSSGIATSIDVDAVDVTIAGSPPGTCDYQASLQGRHIKARNVTANFVGAEKLVATNLTVNAACDEGINVRGKAVLLDSSITGAQKFDVVTTKPPVLVGTTCGTSAHLLADGTYGPTWGVCTND
jgi:hypothetical protein